MRFRKAFGFDNNRFDKHFDRHSDSHDSRHEGRRDFFDRRDNDHNDRSHARNDHHDRHDHGRHDHGRKFWHHDDKSDSSHDASAAPAEAPEGADTVTWTLEGPKNVTVEITAHADDDGNVVFNYELTGGTADLNGFFVDLDNDGGAISQLGRNNSMTGVDSDGDTLDGFDFAQTIGTTGQCDDNTTEGAVVVSMENLGISDLAELADAELGIRVNGTGRLADGSMKLADTGTFVEGDATDAEEPMSVVLDFPDMEAPISVLTLAFVQQGGVDAGDFDSNGLRIVDLNLEGDMPTDLDVFVEQLVDDLIASDSYLTDDSYLKAVVLGGEGVASDYYLYGGVNANGEEADVMPQGAFIDPVNGMVAPSSLIDDSYTVAMNEDHFVFA
ncbi:hypothetical protein [Paracoccus seriniphilus]|uniref:hypothetical protein n=1 Tax=Paracoccus seriniphilus TaxID=184748 RepID=UPI00356ACF04